ncbi:hypothetical protein D3C81_1661860 [compost metagenome]
MDVSKIKLVSSTNEIILDYVEESIKNESMSNLKVYIRLNYENGNLISEELMKRQDNEFYQLFGEGSPIQYVTSFPKNISTFSITVWVQDLAGNKTTILYKPNYNI